MPDHSLAATLTRPEVISLWVQAMLTFAILSFLIKDNPLYKFAEHVFVGISAGYGVIIVWQQAVLPILLYRIFPQLGGDPTVHPDYWVIIPGVLGLLMVSRFIPKYAWLSRWPIAFVVGISAGASIPVVVQANILEQVYGTIHPLLQHRPWVLTDHPGALDLSLAALLGTFNALVLLLGVICVLSYFYFSQEHKRLLGVSSRLGVWFLMIAFGAGFGNTVMARISLLVGRVEFLLDEWWPVVKGALVHLLGR
jgi:hypothetical protein